jgi:hypothetical protein
MGSAETRNTFIGKTHSPIVHLEIDKNMIRLLTFPNFGAMIGHSRKDEMEHDELPGELAALPRTSLRRERLGEPVNARDSAAIRPCCDAALRTTARGR